MTIAWRAIGAAALVMGFGACSFDGAVRTAWMETCPVAPAGIDWDNAPVRTVTWTDGGFEPAIVRMEPSTPYVLHLVNDQGSPGFTPPNFQAPIFFESVQVADVDGMADKDGRCIKGVDVKSGGGTRIHLVTGEDEHSYDFSVYYPFDAVVENFGQLEPWAGLEPPLTPGSGVISVR